ncbi:multivesicular body subunit 12A isoform X1 [Calypte anna]|uniref:multivesicular body subunit 12A isoform X1 n=1 Tax=Calypte anna TaxID=9244 RepID=UPI0011C3BE84|nr:multivesicular body subunit 12A isoform X1 [Calypte anna]XP_030324769.1 multivesicular body subunit 12A isoform X1 [Calypte anna]XP_030324770.1 multivesicular body subunit 12A isoform X1 [Calypte anna]XP_030324771.1 multivesicular body subunit 12A isoform X1 [Calypte anna]
MAAAEAPLSGVGWTATPEAAPAGWTVITVTAEGAAANLGKGFGQRSGGYICVRTGGGQDAPVVTDVQVLSERSPQPPGYTRAPEFPEPRSRKKRLYVQVVPRAAATTAVCDLQLSSKTKILPHYMKIGEMGNFAIWCKKKEVPKPSPPPIPRPRTISTGMRQLLLHPPDSGSPLPRCSIPGAPQHESPSTIYGLSAMDGVPFTLHPKFEPKLSPSAHALLADLTVKSFADIEKEYNYAFVVERTAAARLPPALC